MRHRRIFRQTSGKVPIKHSSTLLANIGPGDGSFFNHEIFKTRVGARTGAGSTQTMRDSSNNEEICQVGDVIKYVNICLECSPRGADSTNIKDDSGWLEWAVVWQEEDDIDPNVSNIGVSTLGVICSHMFRQNCLLTGCFPVGSRQSMVQDIKIKLPRKCTRLRQGSFLSIYCYIRGSSSTDTRTDSNRLLVSSHFKSYS